MRADDQDLIYTIGYLHTASPCLVQLIVHEKIHNTGKLQYRGINLSNKMNIFVDILLNTD